MRLKTKQKHLVLLNEIRETLKRTDKISMDAILTRHRTSKSIGVALQKGGILRTNGEIGSKCRWYWNTPVEPNIKMAEELIRRLSVQSVKYRDGMVPLKQLQKKRKPKQEIFDTTKNEPKVRGPYKPRSQKRQFSLFWGLIKFTY